MPIKGLPNFVYRESTTATFPQKFVAMNETCNTNMDNSGHLKCGVGFILELDNNKRIVSELKYDEYTLREPSWDYAFLNYSLEFEENLQNGASNTIQPHKIAKAYWVYDNGLFKYELSLPSDFVEFLNQNLKQELQRAKAKAPQVQTPGSPVGFALNVKNIQIGYFEQKCVKSQNKPGELYLASMTLKDLVDVKVTFEYIIVQ